MVASVPTASTAHQILVPFTTAARKFERDPLEAPLDELTIRLKENVSSSEAAGMVRPLLDRLHGGADDYEIVVPEELLDQSQKTQRIFNIVMGSIAGISLLVGGIGIMNIMVRLRFRTGDELERRRVAALPQATRVSLSRSAAARRRSSSVVAKILRSGGGGRATLLDRLQRL